MFTTTTTTIIITIVPVSNNRIILLPSCFIITVITVHNKESAGLYWPPIKRLHISLAFGSFFNGCSFSQSGTYGNEHIDPLELNQSRWSYGRVYLTCDYFGLDVVVVIHHSFKDQMLHNNISMRL